MQQLRIRFACYMGALSILVLAVALLTHQPVLIGVAGGAFLMALLIGTGVWDKIVR